VGKNMKCAVAHTLLLISPDNQNSSGGRGRAAEALDNGVCFVRRPVDSVISPLAAVDGRGLQKVSCACCQIAKTVFGRAQVKFS
jgi:hypothetical protein